MPNGEVALCGDPEDWMDGKKNGKGTELTKRTECGMYQDL
jgi:hypothetical protein